MRAGSRDGPDDEIELRLTREECNEILRVGEPVVTNANGGIFKVGIERGFVDNAGM